MKRETYRVAVFKRFLYFTRDSHNVLTPKAVIEKRHAHCNHQASKKKKTQESTHIYIVFKIQRCFVSWSYRYVPMRNWVSRTSITRLFPFDSFRLRGWSAVPSTIPDFDKFDAQWGCPAAAFHLLLGAIAPGQLSAKPSTKRKSVYHFDFFRVSYRISFCTSKF